MPVVPVGSRLTLHCNTPVNLTVKQVVICLHDYIIWQLNYDIGLLAFTSTIVSYQSSFNTSQLTERNDPTTILPIYMRVNGEMPLSSLIAYEID